jgi:hypothetical protein
VNLLQQILLEMRVRFVGTREARKRRRELRGYLLEQCFLAGNIRFGGEVDGS